MVKVAVLVSGGGTNFQALIDAQSQNRLGTGVLSLCIASKDGIFALERAKQALIPACSILPKSFSSAEQFGDAVLLKLKEFSIDVVVLAGFLSVLKGQILKEYENRIINIHPSLIPSFCGEGFYGQKVHEEALKAGVKVTGATVHFVNGAVDGGKIIAQKAVYVESGDTPETLQRRVMEQAEWVILPQALKEICDHMEGMKQ